MRKLGSILFGFLAIATILFYFGNLYYVAVSFSDGSDAVDVIGQYDESSISDPVPIYTTGREDNSLNRLGLYEPRGASICESSGFSFVADSGNNRVLVFENDNHEHIADHIPDYVLGQTNFYSDTGTTTQSGLISPNHVICDESGDRIFVADTGNNRVLVFNTSSFSNGMNASYVLGQANFNASSSGTSQATMNFPTHLAYDETNNFLFVADQSNHRVLVFDVNAITNGENAINVLGQVDFNSSGSGLTDAKFVSPSGLAFDDLDNRLFVADQSNHRVLVFDVTAITNGESAVNVIGQIDFTTNTSGLSQSKFHNPIALAYFDEDTVDGGLNEFLFVADKENARVVVFNVSAIVDGENAINVLGQEDFVSNDLTTDQDGMYNPQGVGINTGEDPHVIIADMGFHRVVFFHIDSGASEPVTNGENAIDAIGQYDESNYTDPVPLYTSSRLNAMPNRLGLDNPDNAVVDTTNHRMFLSDFGNNRILVYDLSVNNTFDDYIPDYVLGKSNFYTNNGDTTQALMYGPGQMVFDSGNNRLFVSDKYNNRVLVFDTTVITNGENAINVLGKENYVTSFPETDQDGLSGPDGLTLDTTTNYLYVGDSSNNRVMVFDVTSITDGEDAVYVLGQDDFVSDGANINQSGFSGISDLALDLDNSRLFVADEGSNRVMVFDVTAITNGEDAINVLGQIDFVSSGSDLTQNSMNLPRGLAYKSGVLFVGDSSNNRVLAFNVSSITNGENAVNVLGQENFTSGSANTDQDGLYLPVGLSVSSDNKLYVADKNNHRIIVFNVTPSAGFSVSHSGGTTIVSESGTEDTFTVVLDSLPASNVVLQLVSEQSNEGTISPGILTFTTDNWSTPQNVTVTGIDDALDDGDISYNVVISVKDSDSDDAYDALSDVLVPVTTLDNDDTPGGGGSQGGGGTGPDFPAPNNNPPSTPEDPLPPQPTLPEVESQLPNLEIEINEPIEVSLPETPEFEIPIEINEPPVAEKEPEIINIPPLIVIPETSEPIFIPNNTAEIPKEDKNWFKDILGWLNKIIDEGTAKTVTAFGLTTSFAVNALRIVFSNPSGLTDLGMRLWSMFLYGFGIKKRHKPWGVVYDSVTKQPLDPVYLELVDIEKKVLATCFTDIDGRYGFLVEPGHYHITVKKTNYIFPSDKMNGKERDELYTDLYYGNYIEIKQFGDVITKNIPMDRLNFDWNEYAKLEQHRLRWYKRSDKAIGQIVDIFFLVGFLVSGLTLVGNEIQSYNVIIFALYGILFAFNHTQFGNYAKGKAVFKENNYPIGYGILRLFSAETNREITHKIIDRLGNYFCLAPKGEYHVSIEQKNPDGTYSKVYEEKNIPITKGYLKKDFKV